MRWAFSAALLLSAALLFTLQPMAAKMLLPILGGSPAVWNTCMVFFQAGLLAGYAYAHLVCARLPLRAQVGLHATLVLIALAALPVAVSGESAPPLEASPIPWVLGTLALSCGLPFFVMSATSPLLQRWYATTGARGSRDPYFLYAASNLGSLGGLLAYPLLVEPALPLATPTRGGPSQSLLFTAGYVALAAAVIGCGVLALARGQRPFDPSEAPPPGPKPSARSVAGWILLAFVPSSLLLGATQYITAEVAAIPLLWAVPLAIYLVTFIVAFGRGDRVPLGWVSWVLAVVATAAAAVSAFVPNDIPWGVPLAVHLAVLFAAALLCHLRLARLRPEAGRLTAFYLAVAAGGVLGGVFNALVAPLVFRDVLEYPLMLVIACSLRPPRENREPRGSSTTSRSLDLALPLLLVAYFLIVDRILPGGPGVAAIVLRTAVPAALVLAAAGRRRGFALALAVLVFFSWIDVRGGVVLRRERSFFAVHRVQSYLGPPLRLDPESDLSVRLVFHGLLHGSTRHGVQATQGAFRALPTTYYHHSGPIGQVFSAKGESPILDEVAVVGLGCGTLAAYGSKQRRFTMYEIDPAVVRIATDPRLFTYLEDTSSPWSVVLGDGRRSLERPETARMVSSCSTRSPRTRSRCISSRGRPWRPTSGSSAPAGCSRST